MENVERIQFVMSQMHGSETGALLKNEIPEWLKGVNDPVPENVSYYLIQRLRDEALIIARTENPAYDRLTRKAIDILNNGGYIKFIAIELNEKLHQQRIAKYTYRIQLSIAIATAIAAIYYATEVVHRLSNWCL